MIQNGSNDTSGLREEPRATPPSWDSLLHQRCENQVSDCCLLSTLTDGALQEDTWDSDYETIVQRSVVDLGAWRGANPYRPDSYGALTPDRLGYKTTSTEAFTRLFGDGMSTGTHRIGFLVERKDCDALYFGCCESNVADSPSKWQNSKVAFVFFTMV